MPAELVPLSTKSSSCFSWSPEQAVEAFLQEIREGKTVPAKMMICWFEELPDKSLAPRRWFSQITQAEEIALLVLLTQLSLEGWRK